MMDELDPSEVYRAAWGHRPDEPQPFSHDDLSRDQDEPQEDPPAGGAEEDLWGLRVNGVAYYQVYPAREYAESAARGLGRALPSGGRVDVCRIRMDRTQGPGR